MTEKGPAQREMEALLTAAFPNADFTLNAKLRSGVRETEGTRILNEEVDVK